MALKDLESAYPYLGKKTRKPIPRTLVGKGLHGLEWTLGGAGDLVARKLLLPAAEMAAENEGDIIKQLKLAKLYGEDRPLSAGDILQESVDFLRTEETDPLLEKFLKGTGKFVASTVADPLTYVGLGLPTKLGKVAVKKAAAEAAELAIKPGSRLAKEIAKVGKEIPKSLEGRPLAEQIRGGQRSLVSIDVPFTNINVPVPGVGTGKVASLAAEPFTRLNRVGFVERVRKDFQKIFSTKTGDPAFDKLRTKFSELAEYRAGKVVEEGADLTKKMRELAGELNLKPKELERILARTVEKNTAGIAVRGIKKVADPIAKALGKGASQKASDILGIEHASKDEFEAMLDMPDVAEHSYVQGKSGLKFAEEYAKDNGYEPWIYKIPDAPEEGTFGVLYTKPDPEVAAFDKDIENVLKQKEEMPHPLGPKYEPYMEGGPYWDKELSKEELSKLLPSEQTAYHAAKNAPKEAEEALKRAEKWDLANDELMSMPHWQQLIKASGKGMPADEWADIYTKAPDTERIMDQMGQSLDRIQGAFTNQRETIFPEQPEWEGFLKELHRSADETWNALEKFKKAFEATDQDIVNETGNFFGAVTNKSKRFGASLMSESQLENLKSWFNDVDPRGLEKFGKEAEGNIPYYMAVQQALSKLGFKNEEDLVPIFLGRQYEGKAGRKYGYGSMSPWTASMFATGGNAGFDAEAGMARLYKYYVPRKDIIGHAAYDEYEMFFRTDNVKKAFKNSFPIAPVFAKSGGEFSWLNPNTPMTILSEVMDWVDGHLSISGVLGAASDSGEGKKPKFNESLVRLRAWLERMFAQHGEEVPRPQDPELNQQLDSWKALDQLSEQEAFEQEVRNARDQVTGQKTPEMEVSPKSPEDWYVPPSRENLDPRIVQMSKEIEEMQARQLLDEQTSDFTYIPPIADRGRLPHIITQEGREAVKNWLVESGQVKPGLSATVLNRHVNDIIRENFVRVKEEVIAKWAQDKLVTPKRAKALQGSHALEHLDEMLEKGIINDVQYNDAITTPELPEVNELARTGKLEALFGYDEVMVNGVRTKQPRSVQEFLHEDPVFATTQRGVKGQQARTYHQFYEELKARGIGIPEADAPQGYLPVPQPELEGFRFEAPVAQALTKAYRFQKSPKEWGSFLKLFDVVQDTWKAWSLGIFPAYHMRNLVGNLWQNWIADITDPRLYIDAKKVTGGHNLSFTDGLGKVWNSSELKTIMEELGVLNRGWYGADIEKSIQKQLQGGKWLTLSQRNKLIRAGFKVGRGLENNSRAAHFLGKLKEGYSPEEAALSVKKFLFDYGDLTDSERYVFKRAFPFYTWLRKNIPVQLMSLVQHPYKYAAPFRVREEVERGTNAPNERYLPQYMIENFPNRVRYNKKTKDYEYFVLDGWLPAMDLVKLLELHEVAANMLTPIPKEILQQAFNYDIYMGRKIEDYEGQTTRLFNKVDVPKRVAHATKLVRLLNEIDKATDPEVEIMNKVTNFLTGKTYLYNERRAKIRNQYEVKKEIDELTKKLYNESRNRNSEKEKAKIKALIKEASGRY